MSGAVSSSIRQGLGRAHQSQAIPRSAATVHLLRKDGRPSGSYDARRYYETEELALAYIERVRELNPGRRLRYTLNGVEV